MSGISLNNTNINSITTITLPEADNAIFLKKDTTQYMASTNNGIKAKTRNNTIGSAQEKVSEIASKSEALAGSYASLATKVSEMSNGLIKLPSISSDSVVGKMLGGMNTATDVFSTLSGNENGFRVIQDNTNPQPAAFKWVEMETTPAEFISYDSVLIFAGEPLYADNAKGAKFIPIGLCEQFAINIANNVTTVQEMRCEEQMVFPGKSQPINISISRICGKWANLFNRLHSKNTDLQWNMSMQYKGSRDLFGLYCMVMDTSRQNIVSSFYLERCAFTNYQWGVSAGEMRVMESANIIAGRIIDPAHKVESENVITSSENSGIIDNSVSIEGDITLDSTNDSINKASQNAANSGIATDDTSSPTSEYPNGVPDVVDDSYFENLANKHKDAEYQKQIDDLRGLGGEEYARRMENNPQKDTLAKDMSIANEKYNYYSAKSLALFKQYNAMQRQDLANGIYYDSKEKKAIEAEMKACDTAAKKAWNDWKGVQEAASGLKMS